MFDPMGHFIEREGIEGAYYYKFLVSATIQLKANQALCILDTTDYSGSAFLPPVADAAGRMMVIINKSANTTTLYPFKSTGGLEDSAIYNGSGAVTSQALAAANAFTVVYSTGERWITFGFDLTI